MHLYLILQNLKQKMSNYFILALYFSVNKTCYLGPRKTSMMERFCDNSKKVLNILQKYFFMYVWRCPKYTSSCHSNQRICMTKSYLLLHEILHKKWSFLLRISSVNVIQSTGNCEYGHIYWRNLIGKKNKTKKLHFLYSKIYISESSQSLN